MLRVRAVSAVRAHPENVQPVALVVLRAVGSQLRVRRHGQRVAILQPPDTDVLSIRRITGIIAEKHTRHIIHIARVNSAIAVFQQMGGSAAFQRHTVGGVAHNDTFR